MGKYKDIDRYIKENLARGYSLSSIKKTFLKNGYAPSFVDDIMADYATKPIIPKYGLVVLGLIIILSLSIFLKPATTGYATLLRTVDYTDNLAITRSSSSEYIWDLKNPTDINSMKLSGSVSISGDAKVYVQKGDKDYLLFDSSILQKQFPAPELTEPIDIGAISEVGDIVSTDKSITIDLEYDPESPYDEDNNGIENTQGIIDLTIKNSKFNWDVDKTKLCTQWLVVSLDNESVSKVCYGDTQCCNFINLQPTRESWDESFYLNYGIYGASYNNLVSAQILYSDYDVNLGNAYVEIVYSDLANKSASFYPDTIDFKDVCVETCSLTGFDQGTYTLIIDIDGASLTLGSINYSTEEEIPNTPPVFDTISAQRLESGKELVIDLSQYTHDADGDSLIFGSSTADNLDVILANGVATIIPKRDFIGRQYLFFTVSDSIDSDTSNVFEVDVYKEVIVGKEETTKQGVAVVGKPVKWVKKVELNDTVSMVSLNITKRATDIIVKKVKFGLSENIDKDNVKVVEDGEEKSVDKYNTDKRVEIIDKKIEDLEKLRQESILDKEKLGEINREIISYENEKNRVGLAFAVREKGLIGVFLEKIAGFFSNLFGGLTSQEDKIGRAFDTGTVCVTTNCGNNDCADANYDYDADACKDCAGIDIGSDCDTIVPSLLCYSRLTLVDGTKEHTFCPNGCVDGECVEAVTCRTVSDGPGWFSSEDCCDGLQKVEYEYENAYGNCITAGQSVCIDLADGVCGEYESCCNSNDCGECKITDFFCGNGVCDNDLVFYSITTDFGQLVNMGGNIMLIELKSLSPENVATITLDYAATGEETFVLGEQKTIAGYLIKYESITADGITIGFSAESEQSCPADCVMEDCVSEGQETDTDGLCCEGLTKIMPLSTDEQWPQSNNGVCVDTDNICDEPIGYPENYCIVDWTGTEYVLMKWTGTEYNTVTGCIYNSDCSEGQECIDNICESSAVEVACIDSDGGSNYYLKGTGSGMIMPGNYFSDDREDYCEGDTLNEYYCGDFSDDSFGFDQTLNINTFSCPDGCEEGACLGEPTCIDSDDGIRLFDKGTTQLSGPHTDDCIGSDVVEYYCGTDIIRLKDKFLLSLGGKDVLLQYISSDACNDPDPTVDIKNVEDGDTYKFTLSSIGEATLNVNGEQVELKLVDCSKDSILQIMDKAIVMESRLACPNTCFEGECVGEGESLGNEDVIEIVVQDMVDELEIEYETDAPVKEEIELSAFKKQIIVSSDIHYSNILTYTTIDPQVPKEAIKLYWIVDGERQEISFGSYDTDDNGLIDYIQWITPYLSEQVFEVEINVLNVYSHPALFGNWQVELETVGTADLVITATNYPGYTPEYTRWTDYSEDPDLYDLKFIELRCGSDVKTYEWIGSNCDVQECSVRIPDYSCDGETSVEVSKVLTPIKHVLKFDFGGQTAYAYNDVVGVGAPGPLSLANTVYMLTNDIVADGTAFTITASNITLDCNGFDITYGNAAGAIGIMLNGAPNSTIRNCQITKGVGGGTSNYGIYVSTTSSHVTITGNDINTNGETSNIGIDVRGAYTTIFNNDITTRSDMGGGIIYGVYLREGGNNTIISNNIETHDGTGHGIRISVINNTIFNNTIRTYGPNSAGIEVYHIYNNISQNVISSSSDVGIHVWVYNNTIFNNTISASDRGISLRSNARYNILEKNTITYSGSHGIDIFEEAGNYPNYNTLIDNKFGTISGNDIDIDDVIGTKLIDQECGKYDLLGENFYFEDTQNGKIVFEEIISESGSNLSDDIQIGQNSIFVNSSRSPGFTGAANLSIYGLASEVTQVEVDTDDDGVFEACNSGTDPSCTNIVYADGILNFTVSHFTEYKAKEGEPVTGLSSDSTSLNEWRMFGRQSNKTSWDGVDYPRIPLNYARIGVGADWSSPAVANGYVYVGSSNNLLHQLSATDIRNWVASFKTNEFIHSSPAVANGYVYIASYDNKLYQLNASNVSQKIAEFETTEDFLSSPAVYNGSLYIGNYDHKVYQLNASN
ncbi:MAG: PQQ-binding-like beta-propeller repeat protein, partial [Nanoarchaeota archaeon]